MSQPRPSFAGMAAAALLVLVASASAWRSATNDPTSVAAGMAHNQLRAAESVLSYRESARVEKVQRFAHELSSSPKVRPLASSQQGLDLAGAVNGTSLGEVNTSGVMIVNRIGVVRFGPNEGRALALPELSEVLEGAALKLSLVLPDAPAAALVGAKEVPVLLAVAPLRDGKDTYGAVIVAEPIGLEFFQNFGQLTGARVSLLGQTANYGNVPPEAVGVSEGEPQLVPTSHGAVFAVRSRFRVSPGFQLGDVVLAVDAPAAVSRGNAGHHVRLGLIALGVALMFAFALRGRLK